ncbi:hypothetical protein D3C73_1588130 [compost metagenome]
MHAQAFTAGIGKGVGVALDAGLEQIITTFDGDQVHFVDMAGPGLGIELMQVHESTSLLEPGMSAHFSYRTWEYTRHC